MKTCPYKILFKAQIKYSTLNMELLAAYLTVIHFRHLMEGHYIALFNDPKKPFFDTFFNFGPVKSDRQPLTVLTHGIPC